MSGANQYREMQALQAAGRERVADRVPLTWHRGGVELRVWSRDEVLYADGRAESDVQVELLVTPIWPSTYRPELDKPLGTVRVLSFTGEELEGLAAHVVNGATVQVTPVHTMTLDLDEVYV